MKAINDHTSDGHLIVERCNYNAIIEYVIINNLFDKTTFVNLK
jgi:hypothetical protein